MVSLTDYPDGGYANFESIDCILGRPHSARRRGFKGRPLVRITQSNSQVGVRIPESRHKKATPEIHDFIARASVACPDSDNVILLDDHRGNNGRIANAIDHTAICQMNGQPDLRLRDYPNVSLSLLSFPHRGHHEWRLQQS